MEITSISHIQKTSVVQQTPSKPAIEQLHRQDTLSIQEGMQEAQKMRQWVEILKEMPDTLPSHFERGGGEMVHALSEVSRQVLEEIAGFLPENP